MIASRGRRRLDHRKQNKTGLLSSLEPCPISSLTGCSSESDQDSIGVKGRSRENAVRSSRVLPSSFDNALLMEVSPSSPRGCCINLCIRLSGTMSIILVVWCVWDVKRRQKRDLLEARRRWSIEQNERNKHWLISSTMMVMKQQHISTKGINNES